MNKGTFKDKLEHFWKNRQHYAMHIFIAEIASAVLLFSLNLGAIGVKYDYLKRTAFADTSLYTNSLMTTISQRQGVIPYMFVSEDDRQCFIMVRFQDMENMTINAGSYSMLLTNVNNKGQSTHEPTEGVKGRIYIFGTSGYMGIYLYTTNAPFERTLKELQVCSSSALARGKADIENQDSLENYDRFGMYINPAGNDAKTADFLENHAIGDEFDIKQIYEQLISRTEERQLRQDLEESIGKLESGLNSIDEYRGRLNSYGLELPERHEYQLGDKVEVAYDYEYLWQTDEEGNQILDDAGNPQPVWLTDENGEYVLDSEGNKQQAIAADENGNPKYTEAHKVFKPGTVTLGGIDFDWYPYNLLRGGYSQAIETQLAGMSIEEYVATTRSEWDQQSVKVDVATKDWYYSNGTIVDKSAEDPLTQAIMSDITGYSTALDTYLKEKHHYEYDLVPSTLLLERNLNVMSTVYTETMYKTTVEQPVLDEAGNQQTDAEGNVITQPVEMYVDDGVLRTW